MQIGENVIDFSVNQIKGPVGDFFIEPKVMQVLKVLVDNAGQVISRKDLIDTVWGVGAGGDERLSRAISILRKSLGDSPDEHRYIQTIPRSGYLLIDEFITSSKQKTTEPEINEDASFDKNKGLNNHLIRNLVIGGSVLIAAILFGKVVNWLFVPEPPLVIIMDSAFPARIYDEETRINGGTNADVLSDILADLPVRTQKELISPNWHRYEAMFQFDPELILIHYSGFKQEDASGDRPQLKLLIEYFLKSDTQILVYSRATQEWLDNKMNVLTDSLTISNSELQDQIYIYPLLEFGQPHWYDPATAQAIKLQIKEILEID